ncbi:MAG: hypothetical protein IT176_14210 [Acidobacteria bacterium]|nr:hypothetical protein [Acidobacteriota bacterium]
MGGAGAPGRMGIVGSNAAFYLEARRGGVTFARTLTLGRQRLYVTAGELRSLADTYRPERRAASGALEYAGPADDFLRQFLDVEDLRALDHSAYEGAALVHDLNQPLPSSLHAAFDAVIDAGTLEHVFNFPVAVASCMEMVRPGGRLFIASPANNMCGHGFYQFSPELFFRLFDAANGFALERLVLVTHPFPGAELSTRQTWYEVTDPAAAGTRASLMTPTPAFLMVQARRTASAPISRIALQQSDYVARWQAASDPAPRGAWRARLAAIAGRLPPPVRNAAIGWYQRAFACTLRNRRLFRPIDRS